MGEPGDGMRAPGNVSVEPSMGPASKQPPSASERKAKDVGEAMMEGEPKKGHLPMQEKREAGELFVSDSVNTKGSWWKFW